MSNIPTCESQIKFLTVDTLSRWSKVLKYSGLDKENVMWYVQHSLIPVDFAFERNLPQYCVYSHLTVYFVKIMGKLVIFILLTCASTTFQKRQSFLNQDLKYIYTICMILCTKRHKFPPHSNFLPNTKLIY